MDIVELPISQKNWLYNHAAIGEHEEIHRHLTAKVRAKKVKSGIGYAKRGAQYAKAVGSSVAEQSHVHALATGGIKSGATGGLYVAGGATGIGLAALTLGSAALSMRSTYKTHRHIKSLDYVRRNPKQFTGCQPRVPYEQCQIAGMPNHVADHDYIEKTILPYIILKKWDKRVKKGMSSTVVLKPLTTLHRVGKAAYKYARHTKGVNRARAAEWLAFHLHYCDCELAHVVVSELLSAKECVSLQSSKGDIAVKHLKRKMKST